MKHLLIIICFATALIAGAQVHVNDSIEGKDSLKTIQIDEVEVTANRNQQRMSKGGLITDVQNTSLSELGTCRDVISQLPGVRTDGGEIEIIGRGAPQFYINGRKLLDMSELDRLSSKEIRNIEVVYNPGARFGAETRGAILIRTIRKQGDGVSGSLQVSGRLARYFSQSDNVFLNYRKGGFDVFGTFNYDHYCGYQKQSDKTIIQTDASYYLIGKDTWIYPISNSYLTNIGVNWQINNDNYIGIKYEYSATPDYRSRWTSHETVSDSNDTHDEISYDINWRGESVPLHLINLYYQGKIGNVDISVNNDYFYRCSNNYQSISEKDQIGNLSQKGSQSQVKSSMFASKGTAEYSFGDNTLEFGYEVTATDRRNIFKNEGISLPDADDRINETTCAGFVAVNIPINKTELYAGLRYEHTLSDYYQSDLYMKEQSRSYSRICPSVDFTFPINKAKFTLSYEAKTKRPLYSQLSSSIQYDDRFTYETGNPLLRSEQIHNFSLAGIYRWMFFSVSYTYDGDAIISVIRPYKQGEPQNIMTYDNFNHLSKYNIVLSLSPRIDRWSPRLRINLSGQRFSMETVDGLKRMNTPILFVNFFNSVSLGKGFTFNGDISVRSQGDMDVVTIKPSWQINLGLSKNIKDWFFQLQATDIFRTARNSMITHGYQMTLDKWNYSDTQSIRVLLRYSFNAATNKYKGKGAGLSERNRL
ncbi:MAG: outer membrane beta-barrel family protein [Muribaculaceae bacterium]|nr:outer membrane beta-barrel family protein [Muribaculaceae bacterium]